MVQREREKRGGERGSLMVILSLKGNVLGLDLFCEETLAFLQEMLVKEKVKVKKFKKALR